MGTRDTTNACSVQVLQKKQDALLKTRMKKKPARNAPSPAPLLHLKGLLVASDRLVPAETKPGA
jgi:hypothetical protein